MIRSLWWTKSTSPTIRSKPHICSYSPPYSLHACKYLPLTADIGHVRVQVHKLCQASAPHILSTLQPNLIIAIGGGGYVPARILRSFLKQHGGPNIPIQAIGLSLYESLPSNSTHANDNDDKVVETPGTKVTRTQWLDLSSLGSMAGLVGKNILIVDEVDDTRTTLDYAVRELEKDVEAARQRLRQEGKEREDKGPAKFSIFVLHNKDKPKKGHLPGDMMEEKRYLAAQTVSNIWICYPWEATYVLLDPNPSTALYPSFFFFFLPVHQLHSSSNRSISDLIRKTIQLTLRVHNQRYRRTRPSRRVSSLESKGKHCINRQNNPLKHVTPAIAITQAHPKGEFRRGLTISIRRPCKLTKSSMRHQKKLN